MNTVLKNEAQPVIPSKWLDCAAVAITHAPPGLDRWGWNFVHPRRAPGKEPFDVHSVGTAIAFILTAPAVRRIGVPKVSSYLSSYSLKHHAERWGNRVGLASYVANGDLILGALYCGVPLGKPHGPNRMFCGVALRYEEEA